MQQAFSRDVSEALEQSSDLRWDSPLFQDRLAELLGPDVLATLRKGGSKCLERSTLPWHFTSSAVVFRRKENLEFLVLHHLKAEQWVYPGGHVDGDSDFLRVALKEIEEETGCRPLRCWFPANSGQLPLPCFAQWIPIQNPQDPPHSHLDVVYCFEVSPNSVVRIDPTESKDFLWIQAAEGYASHTQIALESLRDLLMRSGSFSS